MNIKIKKLIALVLLGFFMGSLSASEKIIVERYESWNHPVLAVFKKYGISLYKISYSKNGTCPTFFGKFKYSADPRAPHAKSFESVYFEVLKANSLFPYALVDEEDDLRINVGWEDKAQTTMIVDIKKANSVSNCMYGTKKHS